METAMNYLPSSDSVMRLDLKAGARAAVIPASK